MRPITYHDFTMNTIKSPEKTKSQKWPSLPERTVVPILRQSFTLKNTYGLHARPSALLVRTLQPFVCLASVERDGHAVNARSIIGVLSLAAGYDSSLTFTFQGDDASQALVAVKHLFDTQFGEAYQ